MGTEPGAHRSAAITGAQRHLYGAGFAKLSEAINEAQCEKLSADAAADRIVELVEARPAPMREPVGPDAERIRRLVAENSDVEIEKRQFQYIGLN